jgi:HD superfamily phosphohydrolase YqeK
MNKSILDDLLTDEKNSDITELENKKLQFLINEINLISDDSIKAFVRSLLIKSELFWTIPASFSGKNHPYDERSQGGNALHTKRVVRIVCTMAESYNLSIEEKDMLIAAGLIHDLCKGVVSEGSDKPHYDPMHAYTVGNFVEKCKEQDKKHASDSESSTLYLSEDVIQSILRLVRCHLGPWSPVPETYPITYLDFILHLSDNIASKLHTYIDDSELINPTWRSNGLRSET